MRRIGKKRPHGNSDKITVNRYRFCNPNNWSRKTLQKDNSEGIMSSYENHVIDEIGCFSKNQDSEVPKIPVLKS